MATINFIIRKKSKPAAIYVRFKHGKNIDLVKSTNFLIDPLNWNYKKKRPFPRNVELKNLTTDLINLEQLILRSFNNTSIAEINSNWLKILIAGARGELAEAENIDSLVYWIDRLIESAHARPNGKGGVGLTKSRINAYKRLRYFVTQFQGNQNIKVEEVDLSFRDKFLDWMTKERGYDMEYAVKKLNDIKSVCNNASAYGAPTSPQLRMIKPIRRGKTLFTVLSNEELKAIGELKGLSSSLANVRDWLLIGCFTGQRGNDFLSLTAQNITKYNGELFFELVQQKTGRAVVVPVLEEIEEIVKTRFPYKVSLQKFNSKVKEVCKLAGINETIRGSKMDSGSNRKIIGYFPKHELITSHVCRRSFATNLYSIIPTSLIMKITGHSSERTFYKYIGKNPKDYAKQMKSALNEIKKESKVLNLKAV